MDSNSRNDQPWEQFLREWPIERLESMQLEEYTHAGSKDTFTYWIESRLDMYGSIWGGSAFKFGIYSRRDTEAKDKHKGRCYNDQYAWYEHLGEHAEQAFLRVRQCLVSIAQAARAGHLQDIQRIADLGEAYKWKVAYHYQRLDAPCIVGIFKKDLLRSFLGITDESNSMLALQQAAIRQQRPEEKLFSLGHRIWEEWQEKEKSGLVTASPDQETETSPLLHQPFNRLYYGPPGTGKTYTVQNLLKENYTQNGEQCYRMATFHQSFGYEEFVEGLRPVLNYESGQVHYEIRSGVFTQLCEQARRNPQYRHAMVIDEINRGNVSRILGELITLIETDKRSGMQNESSVTLAYSGKTFSVPGNVDIIGTMNTADRSLTLLDTALRRRFEFVPLMPDTSENGPLHNVRVTHKDCTIDIRQMLHMMNARIEALYDRDHTLGHAFFTSLNQRPEAERFEALKNIFHRHILPLLEEYFFEDWQKIRLVLGDNQKPKTWQFIQEISTEKTLTHLFSRDHELDQYAIRPRFEIQPEAFDVPEAYLGIYSKEISLPAEKLAEQT